MEDVFDWLQRIFLEDFCNGDWEHCYQIKIATLDNPGWEFIIDLVDTDIIEIPFEEVHVNNDENDWYVCFIKEGQFNGAGGPKNLRNILEVFRTWYIYAVKKIEDGQNT